MWKAVVELIRLGVPERAACRAAMMSYADFRNWMSVGESQLSVEPKCRNPEYKWCAEMYMEVVKAKCQVEAELIGRIKKMGETDLRANTYLLEHLDPESFGPESTKTASSGDDIIQIVDDMSVGSLPNPNVMELEAKDA